MDTGCVGCISFNDPQLGRGKPSTASSTSHLPASCSLQPRPQSPPRPCASAQRRGELFPKQVFVSPSGSSLFPQSAEFESVPGEQWERQVPRGVAQHTSGSFLPRVPGPPVETARHLCFCYLMTKKKKKNVPKSTSLPSSTANATNAPCFPPKSQTRSLFAAPSGCELFPGEPSALPLLGVSKAWGISSCQGCVLRGIHCLGSYLLAGMFHCDVFHFLLPVPLALFRGLRRERCLVRYEMRSIQNSSKT